MQGFRQEAKQLLSEIERRCALADKGSLQLQRSRAHARCDYLPARLPDCLPACLPTDRLSDRPARNTYLPACLPAYLSALLHACLPTYLPTYIQYHTMTYI